MLTRQQQRVDEALFGQFGAAKTSKFGVEEATVKFGVVGDHGVFAQEVHQPVDDIWMGKGWLASQPLVGDAGYPLGGFADRPAGIDVDLELASGGQKIYEFDAADFDDAVAVVGFKPGGFGVEDDFSHVSVPFRSSADAPAAPAYRARPGDRNAAMTAST